MRLSRALLPHDVSATTCLSKLVTTFTRKTSTAQPQPKHSDCTNTVTIAESADGIRYASLPQPECWSGLTRLVAIVNAGSRYENSPRLRGIGHLIRRSFCLSTDAYTAVNLTRHIQQMGGDFRCTSTRDHLIYSAAVAPNLASRAAYLIAHMASRTAFYEWELKDQAYKLMQKDIDILNRRKLDALTIELLYEASFGSHPEGNGLGNSLFSAADQLGNFSIHDINNYFARCYTPENIAFIVSGNGPSIDGLELCQTMKDAFHINSSVSEKQHNTYGFIGGEIRKNLVNATVTHAALAWPTPGNEDHESILALSIFSRALQSPIEHVSYARINSLLNPDSGDQLELAFAAPLFHFHRDIGLFGIFVTGSCGRAVGDRLVYAREQLDTLAEDGLSEIQFERAKVRLKSDVLMHAAKQVHITNDLAFQLVSQRSCEYLSPEDECYAIDKLNLTDVNKIFKSVISSRTAALSVVGSDVILTPPLSALVYA